MSAHLYLSPHLDDAVYSCGGLIARQLGQGDPVTIITVCAGDPPAGPLSRFAQELHRRWGSPSQPVQTRREEDLAACALLGASALHIGIADAIYRKERHGEHLYPSEETVFGRISDLDADLVSELAQALEQTCEPSGHLYCPLALGGHVDHQLTRLAAERLNRPLRYYPDFPYAARGGAFAPGLPEPRGVARVVALSEQEILLWRDAAAEYRSQTSTFWQDEVGLLEELRRFQHSSGGATLLLQEAPP